LSELIQPSGEFALPPELATLSKAGKDDLHAEALIEDATIGDGKAQPMFDTEVEEPDEDAPWRYPIGAVVWAKMDSFPFWPAVVEWPRRNDRDTRRLREHGSVFVRFLGWNEARAHAWVVAELVMKWEDGVAARHQAKVIAKLSHRKLFNRGLRQAEEWLNTYPVPPPGAPPWWLVHAALGLHAGEEGPHAAARASSFGGAAPAAEQCGRRHGGVAVEAAASRAESVPPAPEAAAPSGEVVKSPGGDTETTGQPRVLTDRENAGRWLEFLQAQVAYVGAALAAPSGSARAAGEETATFPKRGGRPTKAAAAVRRSTATDPRPKKPRQLPPNQPQILRQSTLRFSSWKLEQQKK
jgi:hypothetical protein